MSLDIGDNEIETPFMIDDGDVRRLRLGRPTYDAACNVAEAAQGLADATRVQVASLLNAHPGGLCVHDAALVMERSESLVGHHLVALRKAALATSRKSGKKTVYELTELGARLLSAVWGTPRRACN